MTGDLSALHSVSAVLESLAAHVAQHWPDRLLASFDDVTLVGPPELRQTSRLRVEQLGVEGSRVRLRVLAGAGPCVTASATLRDMRDLPPRGSPLHLGTLGAANAHALYQLEAAGSLDRGPVPRVLRAVRQQRPGRLCAELEVPGGAAASAGTVVGHTGPAVVEGMLQLGRWTWYALSGDCSVVEGFERLSWFRLPRPGEALRLEALLKGTRAELPCLDVRVRTAGGEQLMHLGALRLIPLDTHRETPRPNGAWQRFLSLLEGEGGLEVPA